MSHEQLARVFKTQPIAPNAPELQQKQQEFLAKLAHEPDVVTLFSTLMGQHYASFKERNWSDISILDIDSSTLVLLYLIQYLRGRNPDWSPSYDTINERIHLQVLLPQFHQLHPLAELCDSRPLSFLWWHIFNALRQTEPYYGDTSLDSTQKTLGKLFADLQLLQSWFIGNRFAFNGWGWMPELKNIARQIDFATPRMSALAFLVLDPKMVIIYDLNYQRELRFVLGAKFNNLYDALKHVLSLLQQAGEDLSNTIFILPAYTFRDGNKYTNVFTKVVTEFGAHYFVLVDLYSLMFRVEHASLTASELWSRAFVNYKSLFSVTLSKRLGFSLCLCEQGKTSVNDWWLPPGEGLQSPILMASSLELDVGENRKQLLCAWVLLFLYYFTYQDQVKIGLENGEDDKTLAQLESDIAQLVGLKDIKQAFDKFVWQLLRQEGKVKDKEVNTDVLKYMFSDLAVFLHYFALFSKPALEYMREYRQSRG